MCNIASSYLWTIMAFVCLSYGDQKFTKLRNLKDLTSAEYDKIFLPHYSDQGRRHASHDVHLQDDNGRYIKLSYESTHASNVDILKLDEPLHQNNVVALSCVTDGHNREIVALTFTSKQTAIRYHDDITSSLDSQQRHFITAKHKWLCDGFKKERYHIESIFREITAIESDPTDDTKLRLSTRRAALVDVFEALSVSYETNINHEQTNHILGANIYATGPVMERIPIHRRRLRGRARRFFRRMWEGAKNGVKKAIHYIGDVVKDIKEEEAQDAIAIAVGLPVQKKKNFTHAWNWNYDNESEQASEAIHLSDNLTCDDCFSDLDVAWSLTVSIKERQLEYLEVFAEGHINITSDVTLRGAHDSKQEYIERTPKEPLPDLSFSIAGIDINFNIYGEAAVGVSTSLKKIATGFNTGGRIKKGLKYNKSVHHQYNYINEHEKFHYGMSGPQTELASGDVLHYVRSTVFLEMEHLGEFYFGLQPTFALNLSHNEETSKCVVHYAPSMRLNTFIGGDLTITDWHKKTDFAVVQTNLDNLAGCIDKSQVVRNQISEVELEILDESDIRRLLPDGEEATRDISTYLNYPGARLRPKFSGNDKWDNRSSEWWGNVSEISDVCEDWSTVCSGFDIQSVKPRSGTLKVSLANDSSIIGIYRTVIDVVPSVHWGFDDALIQTNISCLARHRFDLMQNTFANDGIRQYKVVLLEWYCDTDLADVGLDATHHEAWECMIRLPEEMSAISLDASLGSVVLFDSGKDWCHVYTLTTKPKFLLSDVDIDWQNVRYPSKLWYGIWDCDMLLRQPASEAELHFISYDHTTGETQVIMRYNRGKMTFHLDGYIDLERMTLKLESKSEQEYWNGTLQFIGVLDILYDGTAIFAGSIEYAGCSGFLFQGYLDVKQFEYTKRGDDDKEDKQWRSTEAPVESVHVDHETPLLSDVVIATFFIGMVTSAVIIVTVGAICRKRQKEREQRNYALMGDHQL